MHSLRIRRFIFWRFRDICSDISMRAHLFNRLSASIQQLRQRRASRALRHRHYQSRISNQRRKHNKTSSTRSLFLYILSTMTRL